MAVGITASACQQSMQTGQNYEEWPDYICVCVCVCICVNDAHYTDIGYGNAASRMTGGWWAWREG